MTSLRYCQSTLSKAFRLGLCQNKRCSSIGVSCIFVLTPHTFCTEKHNKHLDKKSFISILRIQFYDHESLKAFSYSLELRGRGWHWCSCCPFNSMLHFVAPNPIRRRSHPSSNPVFLFPPSDQESCVNGFVKAQIQVRCCSFPFLQSTGFLKSPQSEIEYISLLFGAEQLLSAYLLHERLRLRFQR